MPLRTVAALWPLFFGLSLIGLTVGVQASLLGVRAELEGFADGLIGAVMSSYYAGFLLGSLQAPRLIQAVGHIRTFGAVTALASITILIHASHVEPWTWVAMRFLTGLGFSTIYVVAESWLNQAATNENRGQILALYMVILLAGTCAGQFMLALADPQGFTLFIMISVLVSLAAIPILMTVIPSPVQEDTERVSIAHMWHRAPMGVVGVLLVQWCTSVMAAMGAVYAAKTGMSVQEIAVFMGIMMGGGMLLQWPLGHLSDIMDRRWVMGIASLLGVAFAVLATLEQEPGWLFYLYAFALGGLVLSQYSIVVALIHDHLRPTEIVPASGTIVLLSGIVSVAGPLMASLGMAWLGPRSFFPMLGLVLLAMAVICIWRVRHIPALPSRYKTHVSLQAAATPVGVVLQADEKAVEFGEDGTWDQPEDAPLDWQDDAPEKPE